MSARSVLAVAVAAAVLIGGFAFAEPAAADPSVQPVAASVYTVSVGRVGASLSALVGLLGAVGGGLALARPTRQRLTLVSRRGSNQELTGSCPRAALFIASVNETTWQSPATEGA